MLNAAGLTPNVNRFFDQQIYLGSLDLEPNARLDRVGSGQRAIGQPFANSLLDLVLGADPESLPELA